MSTRLARIRQKSERANQHIREFERDFHAFRDSNPYRLIVEDDPNSGERIYKVRVVAEPPQILSLIAGDAIHNLRSSLDHLAWSLVEANGGTPGRRTCFPIHDSCAKYKAKAPAQIQGMHPGAVSVIDAAEPYGGGAGKDLWTLHQLDITDKHRLLLVVGYGNANPILTLGSPSPTSARVQLGMSNMKILDDGTELGRTKGMPDMDKNLDVAFEIAFREPQIVQGQPVLALLNKFSNLVDALIGPFAGFL